MMKSWQQRLAKALRQSKQCVILGVGNDLKADDGVGLYIIEQLQNRVPPTVELINASTVPENFINHLIEVRPSLIIIIDAALMKANPGTIQLIDKNNIGGVAFSTHQLPLTFFVEYLESQIQVEILILGIQPLTDEFAKPLSETIQNAANQIVEFITGIFQ
jgi:hydrogenase 3 maturation protease